MTLQPLFDYRILIKSLINKKGVTDRLLVKSGRLAFSYIISTIKKNNMISKIILPNLICDEVVDVAHCHKVKTEYYNIDDNLNYNIHEIEDLTDNQKSIILFVNYFGFEENHIISKQLEHNLIIEDNAQALGAYFKNKEGKKIKTGCIGDIGTTSFFPSKNLGCYGDGGAIFTNNDELAHLIRGIANHGMYKRYYHDVVGVNSRLDSIQAVVLNEKLKLLDTYNEKRRKSADTYTSLFKNNPKIITPKVVGDRNSHVFHQ